MHRLISSARLWFGRAPLTGRTPPPVRDLRPPLFAATASDLSRGYHDGRYQGKEHATCKSSMALIINALRLGERKRASTLLNSLVSEKCCLKADDFIYIFDFCSRTPDPLFAMETWKLIDENKVEMNNECWMHIMRALCGGGFFNEAYNLLRSLSVTDLPIIHVCNSFLMGCLRSRNSDQANQCLQLMETCLIGKSEFTYMVLLKLAVQQMDLSLVHKLCKEFKKYYELNFFVLHQFVRSFSKLGDLESARGTLREMVALSIEGCATSEYYGGGKCVSERVDIPILRNAGCTKDSENEEGLTLPFSHSKFKHGKVPLLFPYVTLVDEAKARKTLVRSFNSLIHACVKARNCELAELLFSEMCELQLEPSAGTYDGVVKAVIFKRGASHAAKLVEEMKTKNLKPYSSTMEALSIGYSKDLDLDAAEELINQLNNFQSTSVHPFNSLFAAYCLVDKPEDGIKLLAKMKHLNVKPNSKTYELLFSLFSNVNVPYEEGDDYSQAEVTKRVRALEMDMIQNGVEHTLFTLENMIRALVSEGMLEDALRYLSMAENMFSDVYPGTITYNIILHALVEVENNSMAIHIFRKIRSLPIPLDAATYNIMIDLCSNLKSPRSALSLMSLMLRKGFLLSACTYSTLMKIVLANQDFMEALTLLDQSLSAGLDDVDVLLFNTILKEARAKAHLDIVEFITEKVHEKKIKPDPSMCFHVFSSYVDGGFHTTAMEALQVLSMRMISEDDDTLQDYKALYESLIYSEDPSVESWIVDVFSKSNEHIGAALLNLRWCAICGFDISWSANESPWAQRLSARYGSCCHA